MKKSYARISASDEYQADFHAREIFGENIREELRDYVQTNFTELNVSLEMKKYDENHIKYETEVQKLNKRNMASPWVHGIQEKLRSFIPDDARDSRIQYSPLEFIVEGAKNLGAPGVRFLQLLGQYIEVPEDFQREFSKVYDSVFGQSKLAAYILLEREWDSFKTEVKEIGDSVGGGSLMTVYEIFMNDGQKEVVKVLNPNVEYHTEESFEVIKTTIEALAREDKSYNTALQIIDDIKKWIINDINFENFLEKDRQFYENNNGFTNGNKYSIKVPQSNGIENKFYKREEYIDGINLTRPDELAAKGHDLKGIVSVIASDYMSQIASGLVHSDVHPGNYRITEDNLVAILDRNYVLELDPEDMMLLYGLATSKDTENKLNTLISYLSHYNERITLDFRGQLGQIMDTESGMEQLSSVVRYIRKSKMNLPLKISLMIKNMMALNSLSKSVGFKDVYDALDYKSVSENKQTNFSE